jgi:branched-chain amino acid transport system ATP-binding protein
MPPDAIVGIIGPNGAGKTTIFNLITGVYTPTTGSVRLAEREIVGLKPFKITQLGIARTFQNIRLFSNLSVLDNLKVAFNYRTGYGLLDTVLRLPRFEGREKEITARSLQLLSRFGLADKHAMLAKNLPYGEQRRLEIARALATDPQILLLDEPAAGMNPREVEELVGLIRWIRENFDVTILLIEHQMRLVMQLCEHIQVVDFGETIAAGGPTEIVNNPKVIEAYLGEEEAEA